MSKGKSIPSITVRVAHTGKSTGTNELGMRPMQERAFERRGEQYLLIKSPPASGKSRALMFIALDKLHNQGLRQAIVVVPERTIGASFHDEPLSEFGFAHDWRVEPRWNLCNAPGGDGGNSDGKTAAFGEFLRGDDRVLVCTHATFRFAVERYGIEALDERVLAVDEFHHVSVSGDNVLGGQLDEIIRRDKAHIVAMTGSYFRGDAAPILTPANERKFATVVYTYYEQLNGYRWMRQLDIGYCFYSGSYADDIGRVLDTNEKTIVHIPNVNARESTKDKIKEVEAIIEALGKWQGTDEATGFYLVRTPGGRVLRVADLVDDDRAKRERVAAALKDPEQKNNRHHVDIIIALGMAKEGFDWIWCEHALTVGYRASLTEVVQIIGRATRDAPDKTRARFTNLIAEPDASGEAVAEAVNDTLKAIAASLLMEQVLAPRFEFVPKGGGPQAGIDYGPGGYDESRTNVGVREDPAGYEVCQIEVKGLVEPTTDEARKACRDDINDLVAEFVQDRETVERGMFDGDHAGGDTIAEELTQVRMGKIVKERYPDLPDGDQEAIRQRAVATMNLTQQGAQEVRKAQEDPEQPAANTQLIDGVRKYAMDVRELDIDMIDRINPFGGAYAIVAKTMDRDNLRQIIEVIAGRRVQMSIEDARMLAKRAVEFKEERGRLPSITAADPWERKMAEGVKLLEQRRREQAAGGGQ